MSRCSRRIVPACNHKCLSVTMIKASEYLLSVCSRCWGFPQFYCWRGSTTASSPCRIFWEEMYRGGCRQGKALLIWLAVQYHLLQSPKMDWSNKSPLRLNRISVHVFDVIKSSLRKLYRASNYFILEYRPMYFSTSIVSYGLYA